MEFPTVALIILIVYIVAVIVVLKQKTNKKEKTELIKCNVCGNKIPLNIDECPYCHVIMKTKKED